MATNPCDSGNINETICFGKTPDKFYELVFDYESMLSPGEVVKDVVLYVNDEIIEYNYDDRYRNYITGSGSYESVFVGDPEQTDKDTVLLRVNSGLLNSGYAVKMTAITNRRNEFDKIINVYIDEYAYPEVYDDLEYRFLVDDNDIYILPVVQECPRQSGLFYNQFWYNNEYTVTVDRSLTSANDVPMCKENSFWFTSKYCPMFTTASRIILMLGPEAEKFTVDTINRYIHRASKEAIDLMNISPTCGGNKIPYDYYGCTPDNVPYNLQRYVECKTAYDLLNLLDRLRKIGGTAGGQTKTLGDMTIKYNGDGSSDGSATDPKKDLYDCYMGLQGILSNGPTKCGTGAGINNGVRGKYDTSKGYAHPTQEVRHNRVVRPKPNGNGPWHSNSARYPRRSGRF